MTTKQTSFDLASFWSHLGDCQRQIDAELLPRVERLVVEDPALLMALENLSAAIRDHFEKFQLVAVPQRRITEGLVMSLSEGFTAGILLGE